MAELEVGVFEELVGEELELEEEWLEEELGLKEEDGVEDDSPPEAPLEADYQPAMCRDLARLSSRLQGLPRDA